MVCLKSTNSEPTHAQLVVMCVDLHVLVCDHSLADALKRGCITPTQFISIPSKYCVHRQHTLISARTHTQTYTHDRAPADHWRGAGRTHAARTACACGGCRRGFVSVFCYPRQVSAYCGFHSRVHLSILKDKVGDTCVQDTCREHIETRISLS